jgi:sialidase-1
MKLCALVVWLVSSVATAQEPGRADLFTAGTGGYAIYRIPGIVVTKKGTVLVYCEARKSAKGDWGTIDVMTRRGADGGATFDAPRKIVEPPAMTGDVTVNNPLAIADPQSGAVHFFYCINYARCFYTRSDDDGVTFSKPVEITSAFEELRPKFDWKVIATGPGHGIRMENGRLLVPVWLALRHSHRPSCVATIYSDDDGKTWHAGDIVVNDSKETPNPSETAAVQLADGRVLVNVRNESLKHRRAIATSADGAHNWTKPHLADDLFDPICMASMIRRGDTLLFLNPAGDARTKSRSNLTLRLSKDDGKTWSPGKLVEPGIAAYSDMALLPDGTLLTFYESGGVDGKQFQTKSLRLTRIPWAWVQEK